MGGRLRSSQAKGLTDGKEDAETYPLTRKKCHEEGQCAMSPPAAANKKLRARGNGPQNEVRGGKRPTRLASACERAFGVYRPKIDP